jgi:hypothetical protein
MLIDIKKRPVGIMVEGYMKRGDTLEGLIFHNTIGVDIDIAMYSNPTTLLQYNSI